MLVEVEAGSPLLTFAVAEVFHELSGAVAEPEGDRFVWSLAGEVESGVPSVGGGAGFFG